MNRISEASQDYYLVGFEPSEAALSDRSSYRRIRVRVKRPGTTVSARTGYSMGPVGGTLDARDAMAAAMRAPFSQQGLRVDYTTYVLRGATGGDTQRVVLSLAAELPVALKTGTSAEVVFGVRDASTGRVAASGADRIPLPEAPRPGATTATGFYRVQFEVPPGTYLMRAIVREPGGLLGSADRRFQVRALGGPGITAGDLILGSADAAGLPVRTVLYSGEALSGVLEVYGRTPDHLEDVRVDVGLLPIGSTRAVTSGRADLLDTREGPSGFSRGAVIDLPLQGVAPGQYVVQATVRTGSSTEAELLRDVTILPGVRPFAPRAVASTAVNPQDALDGDVFRQAIARARALAGSGSLSGAVNAAGRRAWSEADRALSGLDERQPGVVLTTGLTRFGQRDYERAAAALKAAVTTEPADAPVAFFLGWAHRGRGDERAAISAWRAATVADPTLVPAYLALYDAYMGLGERDLARQVIEAGLRALPDSKELRARLAQLEQR